MSKKIEPGMAYNMNTLSKVFAFLSVIFLITVLWVFLDDYLRPWKAIQVEAIQIERQKVSQRLAAAEAEIDEEELAELYEKLEAAREIFKDREEAIAEVERELQDAARRHKAETIRSGTLNSEVSALNYQYLQAKSRGDEQRTQRLYQRLLVEEEKFNESRDNLKAIESTQRRLNNKMDELTAEVTELERQINDIVMTRDLLAQAKDRTKFDLIFAIRNAPFLDFLDPTLEIRQIVLENITDDRYFQHPPKVDRCITCHMFIDEPGFEDQPNPHKTHPRLDLILGENSPHPMNEIGCTVCHGGEGHRVNDFASIHHTPRDEAQKQEWMVKYGWEEPHQVLEPMLKVQHTESSCLKCHDVVEYVPGATVLNEGRELMESYGCYGCHTIQGWEHKRTPGPSLKKVASKITKDFFKSWVWSPKSFNPHTKMPQFFVLDNNSDEESIRYGIAEVNAMAEAIWHYSEDYEPFAAYRGGSVERGKELIREVGCMSCHGVKGFEDESRRVSATAGPYLANLGSKVDGDWLVSWLIEPRHYQPDTIMPSFRLSETEANDIAAFLLSQRNDRFERLEFAEMDPDARDELLVTYFSAFDTLEVAAERVQAMTDRERTLELGHRSLGKYGCFACHDIKGFEDRAPIGPELTHMGSKPLVQFDFGGQYYEVGGKTRDAWIHHHLLNPRRWDAHVHQGYNEQNVMPQYFMSEDEAYKMTVALLGQVDYKIPMAGKYQMSPNEVIAEKGNRVLNYYGCFSCHQVDGWGGNILSIYDDVNDAPPVLNSQGHRVQADWLHNFLGDVHEIRPWLNIRMPSYDLTNDEINTIVSGWMASSDVHPFENLSGSKFEWEPGEREAARQLWESYACASCHTQDDPMFGDLDPSAPDLKYVKRRLRPSWVKKWLEDPQEIMPGTLMPGFWFDGMSTDPDILDGDPERQINALTKLLYEMGLDSYGPGK